MLLAYIIEQVSGKTHGDYLEEHIFRPLGMNDTGHERDDRLIKDRASGYTPGINDLEPAAYTNMSIKTGGGSLFSTVEDLYRWDRALRNGELLSRESVDALFVPMNWSASPSTSSGQARRAVHHRGRSPVSMPKSGDLTRMMLRSSS